MKEKFWRVLGRALSQVGMAADRVAWAAHEHLWANYEYGDRVPLWARLDLNPLVIRLLHLSHRCQAHAQREWEKKQFGELPF